MSIQDIKYFNKLKKKFVCFLCIFYSFLLILWNQGKENMVILEFKKDVPAKWCCIDLNKWYSEGPMLVVAVLTILPPQR